MKYRLADFGPTFSTVPVSIFNLPLAADFRCCQVQTANQFGIFRLRFFQPAHMFLRNDQNVRGSLRVDVFKGERVLVFVDPLGGNLAVITLQNRQSVMEKSAC